MKKILKDKNILEKKPNLKLKPNHYYFLSRSGKYWNSRDLGTAIKDGRGGYTQLTK